MVECFKCKNENPSTANYCMMCGNAISDTAKKRILNLQKIERTKTYRELDDKIKTLERTNNELKKQNEEVKKHLIYVENENEIINKQICDLNLPIPQKSKDYKRILRGEYVFLITSLLFVLLIILLVILKF